MRYAAVPLFRNHACTRVLLHLATIIAASESHRRAHANMISAAQPFPYGRRRRLPRRVN